MINLKLLYKTGNLAEVQELLDKCNDYLLFAEGDPVGENSATELFDAMPENVEPTSKVVLGINKQESLIGVFDLIEGYPVSEVLTLGLMLLVPSERCQGIGSKAYQVLEERAASQGFRRIRLGVRLDNIVGLNFWPKNGFVETGEIKAYKGKQIKVMEKVIE